MKATNTAKSRLNVQVDGKTVPAQTQTAKSSPIITPYPTAGRKVTEFEEKLDRQLAGDNHEKRSRGRPHKEAGPGPAEIDIDVIGQALQIPFDLWSISQGVPELKITTDESVMMAKPVKQLLDHYLPSIPEIAWAWISLGAVSYSIMKSRLVLIAEIKKNKLSPSSGQQKDAARGMAPQGHGGPHPSAVFPTIENIKNESLSTF